MLVRSVVPTGWPSGAAGVVRMSTGMRQQPPVQQPVRIPLLFAGNQIRLMSYNARMFYDNAQHPASPINDRIVPKSPKSIKALAQVILENDPDIIALQEVENAKVLQQLNRIHLKGKYPNIIISSAKITDGRGVRVAFMAKDTVKLIDSRSHLDKLYNGKPIFRKDLLEATFETDTGYRFTLFNAHFKSMRGGEDRTMPIRLDEARTAAGIFNEKFRQNPEVKLMVMGDLNTLQSAYGKPVLAALSGKEDNDPVNDLTEVLEKDGWQPWTHNGGSHGYSKLDYAYASSALAQDVQQAYVSGRFRKRPWKLASDHLPVMVVLEEPDKNAQSSVAKPQFAGSVRSLASQQPRKLQLLA
jgi:endonuclease/exonuclease/phosphatase family metal-dependent hydrolase